MSGLLPSKTPWVSFSIAPAIENSTGRRLNLATISCSICGEQDQAPVETGIIDEFRQEHSDHRSKSEGFFGLGDVIRNVTSAFGAEPCEPCEERRQMLNQMAPKVWWRD